MSKMLGILCAAVAATEIIALFWMGAMPVAVDMFPPPIDKLPHFAAYGVLSGLLWCSLFKEKAWPTLLAVSAIGLLDEIHQHFLPGRTASFSDWLTDFAGAVIIIGILKWVSVERKARD